MTTTSPEPTATASDADVLVDVRGLKVHYPITKGIIFDKVVGHVYAVDGVDLQIRRGETYGLVGESGCGKSTLGRAILHLEPATEGTVTFGGEPISTLTGEDLRRRRKDLQMVFQDPMGSLDPRQSVEALLVEGMKAHGIVRDAKEAEPRLRQLLADVGLPPAALKKYPHEFSGGQRQRIGIARALSVNPELVVADEPVSALDVSVQAQVINLMSDLQAEYGLTYLVIAHDLAVVRHISDRVGVMYLGRMVEIGNEDDIYSRPTHPYTQALLSAVPVPDPTLRGKRDQIVLSGDVPSPANPPAGCHFHTRCWKAQDICRTETPQLELRADGAGTHPSRCHFAEPRLVVETTDVTDNHGLFEGQGLMDRADAAAAGQAGGAAAAGASADTSTAGA